MKTAVTIRQIARESGVSVSTVSRVISRRLRQQLRPGLIVRESCRRVP